MVNCHQSPSLCLDGDYCVPLIYICHSCAEICASYLDDLDECKRYCPALYEAHFGVNATTTVGKPSVPTNSPTRDNVQLVTITVTVVVISIILVSTFLIVCVYIRKRRKLRLPTEAIIEFGPKAESQPFDESEDISGNDIRARCIYSEEPRETEKENKDKTILKQDEDKRKSHRKSRGNERYSTAQACTDAGTESLILFSDGFECSSSLLLSIQERSTKSPGEKRRILEEDVSADAHRFSLCNPGDNDNIPTSTPVDDKSSPTVSGHISFPCAAPQNDAFRSTNRRQSQNSNNTCSSAVIDLRSTENIPNNRDPGHRRLSVSYSPTSNVNHEENWNMVIRMYDIVDSKINTLPYVAGCMIGSDALQVYVRTSPDRNIDACYNELINVLPNDPRVSRLLIVLPETSEPPTPDDGQQATALG